MTMKRFMWRSPIVSTAKKGLRHKILGKQQRQPCVVVVSHGKKAQIFIRNMHLSWDTTLQKSKKSWCPCSYVMLCLKRVICACENDLKKASTYWMILQPSFTNPQHIFRLFAKELSNFNELIFKAPSRFFWRSQEPCKHVL